MDKPRAICLFVDHWPPLFPMHGPARYAQTLARGLVGRGLEIHIVTTHPNIESDFVQNGYEVHVRRVHAVPFVSRFQRGITESFQIWKMIEALNNKYAFDVVEFTNVEGVGF